MVRTHPGLRQATDERFAGHQVTDDEVLCDVLNVMVRNRAAAHAGSASRGISPDRRGIMIVLPVIVGNSVMVTSGEEATNRPSETFQVSPRSPLLIARITPSALGSCVAES